MAVTPLLMVLNEKLLQPRFGTRESDERAADEIDEENPVIIAGFGRFGTIVGRLLRANGVGTTVLDVDSDQVDLLRKLGLKVFYGDATRHDLLRAAGAEQAKLLVVALDDAGEEPRTGGDRPQPLPPPDHPGPGAQPRHAYELLDAGVEHVYRETLDSSLRIGVDALRLLGFRGYQAHRAAQTFRRHDEEALRELAAMRHDTALYINAARQRIQDLEELMLSDLEDAGDARDAGWDTETLREEYGQPADPQPPRGVAGS